MDYYIVEIRGDGEDRCITFDGDSLQEPLASFLHWSRYDRKVSLSYVGEEYEEE